MLLSNAVAHGIADGSVTLVFRRWAKLNVKPGSTLLTVAGVVAVDSITEVDPASITDAEAVRAGARSADEVRAPLCVREENPVYRIAVRLAGPDPREELSAQDTLSAEDLDEIRGKLRALDRRSGHGAWTRRTLELIAAEPERPAGELAEILGRDKAALKLDIRKLKNLGLTKSLRVGYRISPRGEAYLHATRGD